MSEYQPIFRAEDDTPSARLRNQGMSYMLQGAGYGALFFIAILASIYLIVGVSMILPPESKEAPDPTPEATLVQPATAALV